MLVLSREVDEQIVIGENLRVTVVSIRGNQVRLGFEAPPSVSIFREELQPAASHQPLPSPEIPHPFDRVYSTSVHVASSEN